VAVDLEGGRVNRLAKLVGPLPSPARAAAAGSAAILALGRALGAACAHFGITVDYAPVVDMGISGGHLGGEGRCLGANPEEVVAAAETLLSGLEEPGVASCLKHFPGLGTGTVDSHRDLPVLDEGVEAEIEVFRRLARPERAVMVAHALAPTLGEPHTPASLSRAIVGLLDPFSNGPVISDDLEMGALARYGTLGERACAALLAGCHQVLVCNAMDARREVVAHVQEWAERTPELAARLQDAAVRCRGYGQGRLAEVSASEVAVLVNEANSVVGGPA